MEKKSRRSWTAEQKRALTAEAQRRLGSGERMVSVCKELGVLEGSLRLWMRQFPAGHFLPIKLEGTGGETRTTPLGSAAGVISLVTPSGLRFDALDVGDVVVLLEQFR